MSCPVCHSEDVRELGYEDGGGDYGESVTLMCACEICGETFECWEAFEDGAYGTDGIREFYDLADDEPHEDDSAAGFDDGIDGRTFYKNHQPPEVLPVISWLEDHDDDDTQEPDCSGGWDGDHIPY